MTSVDVQRAPERQKQLLVFLEDHDAVLDLLDLDTGQGEEPCSAEGSDQEVDSSEDED